MKTVMMPPYGRQYKWGMAIHLISFNFTHKKNQSIFHPWPTTFLCCRMIVMLKLWLLSFVIMSAVIYVNNSHLAEDNNEQLRWWLCKGCWFVSWCLWWWWWNGSCLFVSDDGIVSLVMIRNNRIFIPEMSLCNWWHKWYREVLNIMKLLLICIWCWDDVVLDVCAIFLSFEVVCRRSC